MAIVLAHRNVDRGCDLFQETFYKIDSGLRPWIEGTDLIYRCRLIMRNLMWRWWRSFHRKNFRPYLTGTFEYGGKTHVETLYGRDPTPGPEEQVIHRDLIVKMWDAVNAKLDGLSKEVWALTRQGIIDRQPQAARLGVDITRVDKARQRIKAVSEVVLEQYGMRTENPGPGEEPTDE